MESRPCPLPSGLAQLSQPGSHQTVDVGFRTDAGILASRHEFDTASIPGLAAQAGAAWHPTPCLHFLSAVLSMLVREVLPTDPVATGSAEAFVQSADGANGDGEQLPPAHLFRLRFTPRRGVELVSLGEVEVGDTGGRWGGVLPSEYVAWRLRRAAQGDGAGGE